MGSQCELLLGAGYGVLCLDNLHTSSTRNIAEINEHPRFALIEHVVAAPFESEADEIFNLACPASPVPYQLDLAKKRANQHTGCYQSQAFSELGDAFNQRVKTYSAGMRSRLTFSAALHSENDALLVDEVLAVGDAAFRKKARIALSEKVAGDQTVVFVSHNEASVVELCDRVLWIENAEVMQCGDTTEVLRAYAQTI